MKKIVSSIKDIAFCLIVAFLINRFVFMFAYVPTGSMRPTIMNKDRIIVDKISLYFKDIKRGDIVVFKSPSDLKDEKLLVKRIIGLPTETVEIISGQIYINEVTLKEPYVYYPDEQSMEKIKLGEKEYFVLGDNRSNSYDARYWKNKTINKKSIIGFARLLKRNTEIKGE